MKGKIFDINWHRKMVAVMIDDGDFSIFELISDDPIKRKDIVQWQNDTILGCELLTNITQGKSFQVYFQNHHVSKKQLKKQLRF